MFLTVFVTIERTRGIQLANLNRFVDMACKDGVLNDTFPALQVVCLVTGLGVQLELESTVKGNHVNLIKVGRSEDL
ncbi:hypothetical protein D3C85_1629880 [compost metagenome]